MERLRKENPASLAMTGVLALPNTDWLAHRFTVSGPAADVAAFRSAAAGAGAIPWCLDLDGLRDEWFLRMLAPPPAAREISVEGARILADTYRDLVGAYHDRVLAAVGCSLAETQGVCGRACPLDLHALVAVPDAVLQLGPDDPASLDWLWTHWGTTRALRHVALLPADDRRLRRSAQVSYRFFSADWTPWRAVQMLRLRWPCLVFDVKPDYGNQDCPTTADTWFKDPAGRELEGRDRSAAPNRKRPRKAPAQTRARRMRRRTMAS